MNSPADIVTEVLKSVKQKGATAAEVAYSEGAGISVSCRDDAVDTIENNHDKSLVVTVYKGQASGSASTAVVDQVSIDLSIEKALSIAALTEADPFAGLADVDDLATEFKDLKTYFDNPNDSDALIEQALEASAAARDYANAQDLTMAVDESNVEVGTASSIYANSNGFLGHKRGSNVSASVVAIGKSQGQMERAYWWDAKRNAVDMLSAQELGRLAAEKTLERLGARKLKSCQAPVVFDPSMAKSLVSHMVQAISGSALYQEASFLKNDLHQSIFPDWFGITEDPFVASGFASRNYDGNGVRTRRRELIDCGVLNGFLLSVYAARRLDLKTTGNAGGAHNLLIHSKQPLVDDLLAEMGTGLLVTSLMGQGFNPVTGDYSRGASGFWVENGQIQYPVSELTIAGNLRDMFMQLQAVGSDVDQRSHIQTGSWLIDGMAIAGN